MQLRWWMIVGKSEAKSVSIQSSCRHVLEARDQIKTRSIPWPLWKWKETKIVHKSLIGPKLIIKSHWLMDRSRCAFKFNLQQGRSCCSYSGTSNIGATATAHERNECGTPCSTFWMSPTPTPTLSKFLFGRVRYVEN